MAKRELPVFIEGAGIGFDGGGAFAGTGPEGIARRPSPEAGFLRRPALRRVGTPGIDRSVREHQLPAFTGPELGFDGVEKDIRGLVRRAELSALLQEAPGDEERALDGAANGHTLPTRRGRSRSARRAKLASGRRGRCQFFSTMRPTTLPARNSSIHFWTSPIGSSRIGVGLILPARASAISSLASASVPTMKPSMVMRL